jgi:site-specific recombinase XerD
MFTAALAAQPGDSTAISTLEGKAAAFAGASRAANTVRAYRSDWKDFSWWARVRGRQALPAAPDTLALYLSDRAASCKVSTLARALSSVVKAHKTAGHESPVTESVRAVWEGIRRSKGVAPQQKAAAVTADIRAMVAGLGEVLRDQRDRALILVGFAGAFRRSELVALDVGDISFGAGGAIVTVRRSKTDQEGAGELVGIPFGRHPDTCPVRALRAWVEAAGITEGAVFRQVNRHGQIGGRLAPQSVALVVKELAAVAGLDASRYAGHSLRAGLATSAAAAGVGLPELMAQTRHKSTQVALGYIRRGNLFKRNAAAAVGL